MTGFPGSGDPAYLGYVGCVDAKSVLTYFYLSDILAFYRRRRRRVRRCRVVEECVQEVQLPITGMLVRGGNASDRQAKNALVQQLVELQQMLHFYPYTCFIGYKGREIVVKAKLKTSENNRNKTNNIHPSNTFIFKRP